MDRTPEEIIRDLLNKLEIIQSDCLRDSLRAYNPNPTETTRMVSMAEGRYDLATEIKEIIKKGEEE